MQLVSNFIEVLLLVPERYEEDIRQEESQVRYGLDLDSVKNYYEMDSKYKYYYGPVTVLERHESDTIAIAMDFDRFHDILYNYKTSIAKMIIMSKLN